MTTSGLVEQSTEIATSLITVSVLLAGTTGSPCVAAFSAWTFTLLVRSSLYVHMLTSLGDVRISLSVDHSHLIIAKKIPETC
jgi:Na+/phosphate symporter